MQLSESKTLENLKTAFANESAAMVRYEIFAEKAKQSGNEEISQVFRITARNEKAHAQIWLGLIYGGIPEAADALEKAMHGENYEWTQMYKEYAETARQEGLDNIADLFEKVGDIEKEHESRFKLFVNKLTDGSLFTSCGETVWLCRNCAPSMRLRMMRALLGMVIPKACSAAMEAECMCETGHTPQMRCTM